MTTAAQARSGDQTLLQRRNPLQSLWRTARGKPVGAVAGAMCLALLIVALLADVLAPEDPLKSGAVFLGAPGAGRLLGTDNLGRDILSRIIEGSRLSLTIGFSAVFFGTGLGAVLGIVSGYFGGWIDLLINRVLDTVMAFPPLVLAIFALSIWDATVLSVSITLGVISAPIAARVVRGSVLSVRQQQYIEAAEAVGGGHGRIMLRHVLPNVAAPIIVIASIQIGNAILAEAALSFLGLGVANGGEPSWGKMLQETRQVWERAWWTAFMPGAAISLAVLSFNLFGDTVRDVLDPRLRQGG